MTNENLPPGFRWQVPVFLVGILTLAGVWWLRPLWHSHKTRGSIDAEVASIRQALEPATLNTSSAIAIGEDLLERLDQYPDRAGEIHFLLGSSYLRRAGEVSKEQAAFAWQKARLHLEQARGLKVPEEDRPRLMSRLAKAWYHTGMEPQPILDCLTQTNEGAVDDLAEYYGMVARLYLRLPTPNLPAALEFNGRQIGLPTEDENFLAPARLLRGELLFKIQKAGEARKVLARIPPSAPRDIFSRARWLRAESLYKERSWKEALPLWEEIVRDTQEPQAQAARALFYLGSCYRKLEQWREATRVWERALQEEAEVAQASALALSEVRLLGPKPATALECFDIALRNLSESGSFKNSLLEPGEARQLVETGVRNFLKQRDFKNAYHLAQLLEKTPPGTNREILGEVFDAWARDCLNRDRAEDAVSHFRDAAAAYAALGDSLTTPAEKAKWYRLGSDRYLLGKNPARAAAVQKLYLAAETAPERLGEGWFTLAEIYRTLHNKSSARAAFHKAIEYPGPSAFRARYQLALMEIEEAKLENDSAKLEDAQTALQQNLDLMRTNPEPETHENTLRALADLLIYRGNFKLAAIRLEETVDRYPRNPNGAQTRKLLADCYRRLASKEDQKLFEGIYVTKETQLHYREQRRHWLQKALAHYQKLVDDLHAEGRSRQLTPQEETVLQQAGFAVAECHFEQGLYPEAIQHFEKLVQQYARQAEALQALKQIARCYWVMNNQAKASETVERVRQALRDTPDQALNGSPDIPSRKEWQEWLDWAAKQ